MFNTQKSGKTTSLWEIGLNIRKYANPKVGQNEVSGGGSKHPRSKEDAPRDHVQNSKSWQSRVRSLIRPACYITIKATLDKMLLK